MNLAMGSMRRLAGQKRFVGTAAAVLGVILVGYQMFYLPQMHKIAKVRTQWKALHAQVELAREALPDLQKEREQLEKQKSQIQQLHKEVDAMGTQLITVAELSTLLGELLKRGEGLQLTMDSIKQELQEDPEQPELEVEMALRVSFEDMVNYLRRVEGLSPFLKVSRLVVSQSKGGGSLQEVQMVLATPLRVSSQASGLALLSGGSVERIQLARSPFVSKERKSGQERQKDFKVTGIAWQQEDSTAIVNEEVVRVGDKVFNLTVQQILPDQVVLSDGVESYTVELAR